MACNREQREHKRGRLGQMPAIVSRKSFGGIKGCFTVVAIKLLYFKNRPMVV
jgi:hypothetical protein